MGVLGIMIIGKDWEQNEMGKIISDIMHGIWVNKREFTGWGIFVKMDNVKVTYVPTSLVSLHVIKVEYSTDDSGLCCMEFPQVT